MNTMMLPSMQTEYGVYRHPNSIDKIAPYRIRIKFNKQHSTAPKTILLSYRTYSYFWGSIHVDTNGVVAEDGFQVTYIPQEIGNKQGTLVVDWVAIW